MTMSKQDFELIAERIYTMPVRDIKDRQIAAEWFADALRATNGSFQRDRFIRAATTGEGIRRSILPRA